MLRELSAYLHIPFCERKCIYCDFYSIENLALRKEFVSLLCQEIDKKFTETPSLSSRELATLFFGGGTPSLLEPNELESILNALSRHTVLQDDCEFTLECNPGTVSLEKLRAYRALGVNRLSFGVQSFDAGELQWLGRIHSAAQAEEAVELARSAGFTNISIDLIFALPEQTLATLDATLTRAIALNTPHISAYNLIVEPGTPLFRLVQLGNVTPLDSDPASMLFEHVQLRLAEAGFVQYEISNYAKAPAFRAKHNLVYWDSEKDYVSFGPSAHEYLGTTRHWNVRSLEQYKAIVENGKLPRLESETLTLDEQHTEAVYLRLRSTGIDLEGHYRRFGEHLLEASEVQALIGDGLLECEEQTLRLTSRGYRFCDGVVMRILTNAHPAQLPSLQVLAA